MSSRSVVVVTLALAGCQVIYGVSGGDSVDARKPDAASGVDSGPGSGSATPTAPESCTAFAVMEDFTTVAMGAAACGDWATPFTGSGAILEGNAVLEMQPAQLAHNAVGCESDGSIDLPEGGIYVEIIDAMTGDGAYTGLLAQGSPGYAIGVLNGSLLFSNTDASSTYASQPYETGVMTWVRLRHDLAAGAIAADYGNDGQAWTNLYTIPASIDPGRYAIDATLATPVYQRSAKFAHLRVCQ